MGKLGWFWVVFPPPPLVLGGFFWQRWGMGWRWVEGARGGGAGTTGAGRHPRGGKAVGEAKGTGKRGRWGEGARQWQRGGASGRAKRERGRGRRSRRSRRQKKFVGAGSGEGRCGRVRVHQRRVLVGVGWVGATGDGVAVNVGRWGGVGRRQGRKVTARRRSGGGGVEGRLGVLGSGFDGLSGRVASLQRRSTPLVARTGEF